MGASLGELSVWNLSKRFDGPGSNGLTCPRHEGQVVFGSIGGLCAVIGRGNPVYGVLDCSLWVQNISYDAR
jgi:hypothetical protein